MKGVPNVEENMSPDEAGFRTLLSTCNQLLKLTQFIDDDFETQQMTGIVFVDLTAAYDIVYPTTQGGQDDKEQEDYFTTPKAS